MSDCALVHHGRPASLRDKPRADETCTGEAVLAGGTGGGSTASDRPGRALRGSGVDAGYTSKGASLVAAPTTRLF